ncbi:dienelactone hydrolase family protein [Salinivibrio sp. ES.052]|uniref:dienelactone hydrolase family protein n=1 Tax=Salinivibrio sp. ES.052 TaxID=1882823 RepID=UPI00092768C6|nr:dienelactone hydrolase family protein [Salinivibrio sp. ES.052]SIN92950.1 Dienelactone hydrolase [Salinivibrio sp. ES.052]
MTKYIRALCASVVIFSLPVLAGTSIDYQLDGEAFSGYLAIPEVEEKGSVVIVHDWDGLTDYERQRADMLADIGYRVFALDMYGSGNRPQTLEAKKAATSELYKDRARMQVLIESGMRAAQAQGVTKPVVAGYCFGGSVALELARNPGDISVSGYASFHGGLETPEGQRYSESVAPIFIAHGGADKAVPMTDFARFIDELESANVTYWSQVYSGAPHAFTVFGSDRYREHADQKAWQAFKTFLNDQR